MRRKRFRLLDVTFKFEANKIVEAQTIILEDLLTRSCSLANSMWRD